jgi:cyclophilin family peptidyl-prolyl cis-trans isomerase
LKYFLLTFIFVMKNRIFFVFLLILTTFILACNNQNPASNTAAENDPRAVPPFTANAQPQPDPEVAIIETTDYGDITIELYSNIAPKMVAQFKELARSGFYNGTTFHRVDPRLGIVQAGDQNSKDNNPNNDGTGNSNLPNVPAEFSDVPFDKGVVGAARRGGGGGLTEKQSWDTANSQFFILTKRQPAFDKRYTVFGKVIEDKTNAVNTIANAPTAPGAERPAENITIKNIRIEKR